LFSEEQQLRALSSLRRWSAARETNEGQWRNTDQTSQQRGWSRQSHDDSHHVTMSR